MRKKLLRGAVAFLMACALTTTCVAATTEGKFIGESVTAKPGETVELSIKISENPGIAAFLITVHCDTAKFSVAYDAKTKDYAIEKGKAISSGSMFANTDGRKGWKVTWFDAKNTSKNGELIKLKITVGKNVPNGKYDVEIGYSNANTVNMAGDEVPFKTTNGSITIKGGSNKPDVSTPSPKPTTPTDKDPTTFSDVKKDHWAFKYIEELSSKGIISGKGDGRFAPNDYVTRAEFVKMLSGVVGADVDGYKNCQFNDVAKNSWYMPYVAWAADKSIVYGTSKTEFSPNANIMREQIAATIFRYTEMKRITLEKNISAINFIDESKISGYAKSAVTAMQRGGIISGYADKSFRPQGNATRAEAAKMLAVLIHIIETAK